MCEELNQDLSIFILPNGLSKKYIQDLKKAAIKSKFNVIDKFDDSKVNIIVSSIDDYDNVCKILKLDKNNDVHKAILVLNVKWITDSNKMGKFADYNDQKYLISPKYSSSDQKKPEERDDNEIFELPDYECQRVTKLMHHNKEFTDALEILEEYAELRNADNDPSRALAFRRSICVLRSLPRKITDIKQLKHLKNIGEHTKNVIKEILDYGYCKEVDSIVSQDYYKTVKLFKSIYGCGAAIANRLYEIGHRSIKDIRENHNNLNKKIDSDFERIKYGVAYFEDLNIPVTYEEANSIFEIIKHLIMEIDNRCILNIVGGFRRGKTKGHDLDILVTHPTLGEEKDILIKTLALLKEKGLIVNCKHDKAAESDWTKQSSKQILDHFERFIGILRFHKSNLVCTNDHINEIESPKRSKLSSNKDAKIYFDSEDTELLQNILNNLNASKFDRDWIARRVDIIICPIDQHPFALLGWTGSKQFNRSIRLYSDKEFNYKLTSHGIYDNMNQERIGAKSEREIFEILKLNYLDPEDRNC